MLACCGIDVLVCKATHRVIVILVIDIMHNTEHKLAIALAIVMHEMAY